MNCEGCGCSDARPCIAEDGETPCSWVAPGKCSACFPVDFEGPAFRQRVRPRQVA
jgi:hypothetical protein